ncbi:MAG TPA: BCCT family transporter, partial [Candidatus Avamphibacillus intestinigallinarum]|nr:BCCT family transporter [Candidatus Avamphibacillus intestinigallinarum]
LFVVTTVDSMAYSISMAVTGDENPIKPVRVFWAVIMATSLLSSLRIKSLRLRK